MDVEDVYEFLGENITQFELCATWEHVAQECRKMGGSNIAHWIDNNRTGFFPYQDLYFMVKAGKWIYY